ncbi:hypothetical protein CRE_08345 [Caenorhabditis remanei]|uniref:Uncharacterized protein n=1 Tax=Caenorhabditis remanei TaxID=31234 RepID=E3MPJ4_CAERE|nr:hypothetical protein CRE_08345 [Caenorhabditis remanei]
MGAGPTRVFPTSQFEETERHELGFNNEEVEPENIVYPTEYETFAHLGLLLCCTIGILTSILFISFATAVELATERSSKIF